MGENLSYHAVGNKLGAKILATRHLWVNAEIRARYVNKKRKKLFVFYIWPSKIGHSLFHDTIFKSAFNVS